MILAFSTSCAWISLALIAEDGQVVWSGKEQAPKGASGALLRMVDQLKNDTAFQFESVSLFVADMGPGSFTGVRVGVTMAKTFGFLYNKPVAGVDSFDLISPDRNVVFPSKKGEFFLRKPGELVVRMKDLPDLEFMGFGPGIEDQTWPEAVRVANLVGQLKPISAMNFVPEYLIEPSISTPKTPYVVRKEEAN